jgi:hypothetical protein
LVGWLILLFRKISGAGIVGIAVRYGNAPNLAPASGV